MKFITMLIKLPSFSEHAKPDWSFTVAGLKIGGYSEGLPIYAIDHISISHRHDAPVATSVPEPSIALLFAVGLVIVLLKRRL